MTAKVLITELEAGSPSAEFYDAKTEELGARLLQRKEQLLSQFKADGLPPPRMRTMTIGIAAR